MDEDGGQGSAKMIKAVVGFESRASCQLQSIGMSGLSC